MVGLVEFNLEIRWLDKLARNFATLKKQKQNELNRIADEFITDPEMLSKHYVEPDCQPQNPADEHEDETDHVFRTPAYQYLQKFLSGREDIKDGRNQLFVLADAGMGKTSLLVMFKLGQMNARWPVGYDCIIKKLGHNTLKEVRANKKRARTVLLLDAMDEDPCARGRIEERLLELLEATAGYHRVIITCRTQFFPKGKSDTFKREDRIRLGGFTCRVVYLSLFTEDQTQTYLKKKYPASLLQKLTRRETSEVTMARDVIGRMKSLRFRPMLLAHIQDLLEAGPLSGNEHQIYYAMLVVWLNREIRKKIERDQVTITKLELLAACKQLAWRMSQISVRGITIKEIEALTDDKPDLAHLESIEISGRSLLNRNSDGDYRFAHYSIQEYLVVLCLADGQVPHEGFSPNPLMISFMLAYLEAEKDLNPYLFQLLKQVGIPDNCRVYPDTDSLTERLDRLVGVNLAGVDMNDWTMPNARLILADLRGAVLSGADLQHADLSGADLSDANLKNTELRAARLTHATLAAAVAAGADLTRANLHRAQAADLDLRGAVLENADLSAADLAGADFREADLKGVHLADTRLERAVFFEPDLVKANLSGVNLREAKMFKARLREANLHGADLSHANLFYSDLRGADLSNTRWHEANLHGADLMNADLEGITGWETADMTKLHIVGVRNPPPGFLDHALANGAVQNKAEETIR